jgi:hypothetical protein
MKQSKPDKSKVGHIIISRFSSAEKEIIRRAVRKAQVRRPQFYHDCIVIFAKLLNEEEES